eukprot:scaffold108255_cov16-Prasinocladus_malaysianus.AAC.1
MKGSRPVDVAIKARQGPKELLEYFEQEVESHLSAVLPAVTTAPHRSVLAMKAASCCPFRQVALDMLLNTEPLGA